MQYLFLSLRKVLGLAFWLKVSLIFSNDTACMKDFFAAGIVFKLLTTVSLDVTPSKAEIRTEGMLRFCPNTD